jgi:Kdo2-lipid IVA lauroyltransferase/acyltransferase
VTASPSEPEAGRYIRPKDIDNRSTFAQRMLWRLEALGWDWLYWKPLAAMTVEDASNRGAAILSRLGPLSAAHRTMLRNLRMVYPDWSEAQIAETAHGAWRTFGHLAGEMPHLSRMRPYVENSRIEVVGGEVLDRLRESRRPAVLFGGHLANWEVMAATICLRPLDCQITYRAANNPYIDRRISEARLSSGVQVLTPKGVGTRDLMRALSRGQSVALMNDQKFNQGVQVPFFGRDAMTAPGPTRLAMKYKTQMIPVSTRRLGPGRYRVTYHEPFLPETGNDEDAAIRATVLRINTFLEARIREAPDQWFWMHNRWPKEAWVAAGVM